MPGDVIDDEEVRNILKNLPKGIGLFEEVRGFYGDDLTIERQPDPANPSYAEITPADIGEGPRHTHMGVVMESDRAPAAVVHELLHLRRWQTGVPFKALIESKAGWKKPMWNRPIVDVWNTIEHRAIFPEFELIGLPPSQFLTPVAINVEAVENYLALCLKYDLKRRWEVCEAIANSICFLLMCDPVGSHDAVMARYLVMTSRIGLNTRNAVGIIRRWLQETNIHSRADYADSVNRILSSLKLPKAQFLTLRRRDNRLVACLQ